MLNILRRHARWEERLESYVDGELSAAVEHEVARHLAGCPPCSEGLAARRAVKRLVAALPEAPAPRSFRITPALLASAPPQPAHQPAARPTAATFAMRTAWMTAAVAAFAVGVVAVLDATGTDGSSASHEMDLAAPAAANASPEARFADAATAEGTEEATATGAPSFVSSPTTEPTPGSVKAAGARDSSPTPAGPDAPVVATPLAGDAGGGADGVTSSLPEPGGQALEAARTASADDDDHQLRALEATLGTLAVVAALVAAVITIRLRRSA